MVAHIVVVLLLRKKKGLENSSRKLDPVTQWHKDGCLIKINIFCLGSSVIDDGVEVFTFVSMKPLTPAPTCDIQRLGDLVLLELDS
jgi:hypothetical protein